MSEEGELIAAAQRGSAEAFSELAARYRERLFVFLLARCPSRADAEDVLQDTLVNAYRYLASYDPRWRFSTWLYRIAIRNLARVPAAAMPYRDEIADPGADPLRSCIDESERNNLWLAARRVLSPEAFAATWLRYAHDLPLSEIAKALDRTRAWTKVTLLRARRRLEKELTEVK